MNDDENVNSDFNLLQHKYEWYFIRTFINKLNEIVLSKF